MKFAGIWHIREMELWDEDYFNMEIQAYVEIKPMSVSDLSLPAAA